MLYVCGGHACGTGYAEARGRRAGVVRCGAVQCALRCGVAVRRAGEGAAEVRVVSATEVSLAQGRSSRVGAESQLETVPEEARVVELQAVSKGGSAEHTARKPPSNPRGGDGRALGAREYGNGRV